MGNEHSTQRKRQKANAAETKVQNGELNGHAVPPSTDPDCNEAQRQKCEIPPPTETNKAKPPSGKEEVDKAKEPVPVETSPEEVTTAKEDAEPSKDVPKAGGEDVSKFFGKMFKKKAEPVKAALEVKDSVDGQVTAVDEKSEPVDIRANGEAVPEPEGTTLELLEDLAEVAEEVQQSEDLKTSEKTVMNFFKTFVSPTKTSKEAKATPDASKDQPQKEMPPAPSGNVQEAPKAPPPPPPAPPKLEGKADAAVKKEETSATDATKPAEASAKTKTKDSAFSKLFRPKILLGKVMAKVQSTTASRGRTKTSAAPDVVEEKMPVEVQVDASKTSTLEAAAKPEESPAPKPEEKKPEKKSAFGSIFKPKVLLGQMSSRIQAAASSAAANVSLMSSRSASEPKKETPAAPAAAESAPAVKAKEDPKPAAPAAPAAPDTKSAESTDNASPNIPRKLEKRNSIQLFFKNLGQKRHSDAGVQTEPVAPEKAK